MVECSCGRKFMQGTDYELHYQQNPGHKPKRFYWEEKTKKGVSRRIKGAGTPKFKTFVPVYVCRICGYEELEEAYKEECCPKCGYPLLKIMKKVHHSKVNSPT